MALPELFERVRGGVFHINFIANGIRLASGSGFLAQGKLITNNHVFRGPTNSEVVIRSFCSDPSRLEDGFKLSHAAFAQRLVAGSDEQNHDYAILDIPELVGPRSYEFTFSGADRRRVGESVVFLGYPLEHRNLVCHAGIISSIYSTGPSRILQVDGSVNASNSGGPLVTADTGEVLGIITRKATGLSQMFEELLKSFDENVKIFEKSRGYIKVDGFDPVAGLVANQHQMKRVAAEIEHSANVGIGYAFSAEHVLGEAVLRNG